jgi:hypothetical protein
MARTQKNELSTPSRFHKAIIKNEVMPVQFIKDIIPVKQSSTLNIFFPTPYYCPFFMQHEPLLVLQLTLKKEVLPMKRKTHQ